MKKESPAVYTHTVEPLKKISKKKRKAKVCKQTSETQQACEK